MYHLPLLPGYDPNVNVRSSVPAKSPGGKSILTRLSEAEENGYEGTYFNPEPESEGFSSDGFIASSSPEETRRARPAENATETRPRAKSVSDEQVAEVVFFAYGVVVFFGLQEAQERSIIDDIVNAGILTRKIDEESWEIEECHFAVSSFLRYIFQGAGWAFQYDPHAAYPRIYNDLFSTFPVYQIL